MTFSYIISGNSDTGDNGGYGYGNKAALTTVTFILKIIFDRITDALPD